MSSRIGIAVTVAAIAVAMPVAAQAPPDKGPTAAVVPPPVCTGCIAKLTVIELMIDDDLGSKISKTGAVFPLHLDKPIVVDGKEVVPAGTVGEGEIIHAKKASGAGTPGELVLAARFLAMGDRQLKLRSLRIAVAGKDASTAVDSYNAVAAGAAVLTPVPFGLLGFAITGRNILIPKGTRALAKIAEDFPLEVAPAAPVDPQQKVQAEQQAVVAQTTNF